MNQSRRSNCMLRSSNARNGCKALVFICVYWEKRRDSSAFKKFLIALFGDFLEWNEVGLAILLKQLITLLWWVQITYTIPREGRLTVCFCINEKQLTKKKEEKQQQQTDKQSNKTLGRSRGKQQFNSFRRTAVKRRLHEEEAFQSWETEGFSKYLQPKSDF